MAIVENTKLHYDRKNYFVRFVPDDEKLDLNNGEGSQSTSNPISRSIRHALEYFVEDLRHNRDMTIEQFLNETNVNEMFRCIGQLLLSDDDRICGNSAFILGSAVETERGLKRFLFTFFGSQRTSNTVDVIRILCHMLTHADSECILNAAGTLGTISGSKEGRDCILHHSCIAQLVLNASTLLASSNTWIASNAALVLARISVEDLGCQTILTHSKHREILHRLVKALDVGDPGRSTNAAFAIARLIEGDNGKKVLIADCGQDSLFEALLPMFEAVEEKGVHKNACYALSCMCTTSYGFQLCNQSLTLFHKILQSIETVLLSIERETVWFALMCLRTVARHEDANDYLLHSTKLSSKLKQVRDKWIIYKDIQEESKILWYILHKNVKPNRPRIDECRNDMVDISWDPCPYEWDETELQYRVILDNSSIGVTNRTNYTLCNLKTNTNYHVQIQYLASAGESMPSEPTIFRTDDELPPAVSNLHLVRASVIAARLAWQAPDLSACNSFKGYQVYLNDVEYALVTECGVTIGNLTATTTYQVDVCAVTARGKGPKASLNVTTISAGDTIPAPPTFSNVGRRELQVKWQPPEVLAGRFNRYELLCNGRSIYSGTDQEYHATMLKPDTEYALEVIVFTNEGRFRSRPAKTRTLRDDYHFTHRHSLYESSAQSPVRSKRVEQVQLSPPPPPPLTNGSPPKASPPTERRPSRELGTQPMRNVQITTVRTLQFKSEGPPQNRALPGFIKAAQSRSTTNNNYIFRRSKTDLTPSDQQKRTSAAIVMPTLDIQREPQVTWTTAAVRPTIKSKTFRFPAHDQQ